ncbi:MAG: hypothetical protein A2W00_03400 [Candidatus Eisenbacteria bacterium RBG_16_71_46]|nr:MAG: hypothetical protein A2W00_03400 [Candidatus Eisenbacteria bacterium RBG_16_71_46]
MGSVGAHLGPGWQEHADPAWLAGWEPRRFELAGGTTEVVAMGAGAPLLLVPPLPGFKEAYLACARPLAARFRVVTFDLRARFDGRARWAALLDDLDRVAAAWAPGAAGVVGHSLGGALAQRWAARHPGRVRALVLSSSFARVPAARGHRWARYVEQPLVLAGLRWLPAGAALALGRRLAARGGWVLDPRCEGPVLALMRHGIRHVSLRLALDRVRLAFEYDGRAELPRLAAPALILVGERESAPALAAAAELERLIPGAERRVSPGAGHLHPLSHPEWFARAIAEFALPRLGGAAGAP